MAPSLRHRTLATLVPRLRKATEISDVDAERRRVEAWHAGLDRSLPRSAVPGFDREFTVVEEEVGGFPSYVIQVRDSSPTRTVLYCHGGGFMAPIDAFHVRYVARIARELDARIVLPDYPLAPEHTWRDSHDALVELADRHGSQTEDFLIAGDSAGGNIALAVALSLRDRGLRTPDRMVLLSPWVDVSTSLRAETEQAAARDPWLKLTKLLAYADWWSGSPEDLTRQEVSPALADLHDLPPTLMYCGTADLLVPGCRLLARRSREFAWDLTYVEEPGLIHVYPLLPTIPEAKKAWGQLVEFVTGHHRVNAT